MSPATTVAPPLLLPDTGNEADEGRLDSARGALVGISLGLGMWAVILALVLPLFIK